MRALAWIWVMLSVGVREKLRRTNGGALRMTWRLLRMRPWRRA